MVVKPKNPKYKTTKFYYVNNREGAYATLTPEQVSDIMKKKKKVKCIIEGRFGPMVNASYGWGNSLKVENFVIVGFVRDEPNYGKKVSFREIMMMEGFKTGGGGGNSEELTDSF